MKINQQWLSQPWQPADADALIAGLHLRRPRRALVPSYVDLWREETTTVSEGLGVLRYFAFAPTSINGATVRFNGGSVQCGVRDRATVADTDIELAADYQYVGIEYDFADNKVAFIGPFTAVTMFCSDAEKFRLWLAQFRLEDGSAALYRIGHVGNIELPGTFAG